MKNSKQIRTLQVISASLIITVIILSVLSYRRQFIQFDMIKGAYERIYTNDVKISNMENYFRNKGLVDGELDSRDVKPYSLQEMEDFQKWYDEQHKDDSEN